MKKIIAIFLAAALMSSCCGSDGRNARGLASRILGYGAKTVVFEKADFGTDCFELSSRGSKVLIRANNSGSMATGLNYYLKNYCNTSVSWYDYNPVALPATLPEVPEPVKVKACVEDRFFLNYCTFGYTMPWWGWKEWERFIDWMALNGVNMPLAITGEEAVWQKVWRRFGMTDGQIRSFFTGPAYLPWHRMINIDRWQGPLPQHWIDSQAELQKRILKRERSLGMRPVLPGFSGHIPAEITQLYPELETAPVARWGGFHEEHRCTFLNSMDPMFDSIQKAFLEERRRGGPAYRGWVGGTYCGLPFRKGKRAVQGSVAENVPGHLQVQCLFPRHFDQFPPGASRLQPLDERLHLLRQFRPQEGSGLDVGGEVGQ